MANYFNTLPLREQLAELGKCRFMHLDEFTEGVDALKGKKIVVIGCGAQGLNPTSPPAEASLSLQPPHVGNTPISSRDQRQGFAQPDGLKIHLIEAAGLLVSSALAISS